MITINGNITIPKSLTINTDIKNIIAKAKMPNPQYHLLTAMGKYANQFIMAYSQDETNFYLKRGPAEDIAKFCIRDNISIIDNSKINPMPISLLNIQLYDYQKLAVAAMLEFNQGVLIAPVGSGKTFMGLKIIEARQQKSLVIVPTQEIGFQWLNDCISNNISSQFIKAGVKYNNTKTITISTVQSLKKINLNDFGCVVVDEAHRCPARVYTQTLDMIPAKYRYGLTGTAYRKDGLTDLIFWNLGPERYKIELTNVNTLNPAYKQIKTPWEFFNLNNNYTELISYLTTDESRNQFIIDQILATRDNKKTLVVTHRVDHCELLAKGLNTSFVLTGELSSKKRLEVINNFKASKDGILVSVYSIVSEGFSVNDLEYLYLTTPTKNKRLLIQIIGRIIRNDINNKNKMPTVFDFIDHKVALLKKQASSRRSYYIQEWGIKNICK